ncbi:uncharacterized protein LOC130285592 isoform X1 [Hyla sarda]|uniref:uncharacterized protein LOC130285592 isoform X1 n=1 Tax=Hyla sarda TaxID=327740 RepID=UPI0024C38EF0|nr:uncharacterized protein LOC130285592 isoform X1 [Hyla sarda]XP_056393167.1 uncharacterized protein LOC130285592 isoform X1 [Hyla sarda]
MSTQTECPASSEPTISHTSMPDFSTLNTTTHQARVASVFSGGTDASSVFDLKRLLWDLENLKSFQLKTWWDATTLSQYLEKNMIPRGLRIRKKCTTSYDEDFTNRWNDALSRCSLELMSLIIEKEELKLADLEQSINKILVSIEPFKQSTDFEALQSKMNEHLSQLEETVTNIKKTKFNRDLRDYTTNTVYNWQTKKPYKPRSILKHSQTHNTPQRKNVSFSSSDNEATDYGTDSEHEERSSMIDNRNTQPAKNDKTHGVNRDITQVARGSGGNIDRGGNTSRGETTRTTYTRKNKYQPRYKQ